MLKSLKDNGEIDEALYYEIKPRGSQPARVLYTIKLLEKLQIGSQLSKNAKFNLQLGP